MVKRKTVLITGAGSGIGKATAIKLAQRGHQVIATTETVEQAFNLQEEAAEMNLSIQIFKLDITDGVDRNGVMEFDLDVLINNAAIGESGSLSEIDVARIRYNFEVNVFSTIELSQLALKKMMSKNSGTIIFISSLAGRLTMPFLGSYSMTKFALSAGTEALRAEIKSLRKSVRVSLIEPGAYHTGFNQKITNTKYEWMNEDSYFHDKIDGLKEKENRQFNLVEKKSTRTIVRKIVQATEARNPKLRYSSPWWQFWGVQFLRILGK